MSGPENRQIDGVAAFTVAALLLFCGLIGLGVLLSMIWP